MPQQGQVVRQPLAEAEAAIDGNSVMVRANPVTEPVAVRFGWLQAANTGLFVVYNDTRGLYDLRPTPERQDRSLVGYVPQSMTTSA